LLFTDGDKRTAITVCGINGKKLIATPKELEDFAVQIAVEHLSVEDIAVWLEARTA
jgi:death on curing protein